MQRVLNELVSALRRAGVRVSTAEAIDALRALRDLGVGDRAQLKQALALTLAKDEADTRRFSRVFEAFFDARGETHADLFQRLRARGFDAESVETLRALLTSESPEQGGLVFRALGEGPFAVRALIEGALQKAGVRRDEDPARLGFSTMRTLDALRFSRAEARLLGLRAALREAHGERGDALADALLSELAAVRDEVRSEVGRSLTKQDARKLDDIPFAELSPEQRVQVERAVRELSERLLGGALVKMRHARRGRLHVPRTMRAALSTGGAPFVPRFRDRTRRAPKLVVLCDVSDSVRDSARFMLLFMHVAQRLFESTRSFLFVADVREATSVFRREPIARAVELAYRGAIVNVADNSHYGRVFRQLLSEHADALDPRSVVVVLGDGRTNHFDPAEETFRSLCRRVSRVIWLSPEPESRWSTADSVLPLYRRHVSRMLPVYDLESLRRAAREVARF